jgi:hypothetical protein
MSKLTDEQLKLLQDLNQRTNNIKVRLGDLEVQKVMLLPELDKVRQEFAEVEQKLVEEYGADTVINIQTGEITKKEVSTEE